MLFMRTLFKLDVKLPIRRRLPVVQEQHAVSETEKRPPSARVSVLRSVSVLRCVCGFFLGGEGGSCHAGVLPPEALRDGDKPK